MSEVMFGNYTKDYIVAKYGNIGKRFSKCRFDGAGRFYYDKRNLLPVAVRCAWLALLSTRMKRTQDTCSAFHTLLRAFILVELNG